MDSVIGALAGIGVLLVGAPILNHVTREDGRDTEFALGMIGLICLMAAIVLATA